MKNLKKRSTALLFGFAACAAASGSLLASPFGEDRANLDSAATGEWWTKEFNGTQAWLNGLKVPREDVIGFALYTHQRGVLKLSAQLYPLYPDEPQVVRLELFRDGAWQQAATAEVVYPGWSAHFKLEDWDDRFDIPYRLRHGESALFDGLIRKDPREKDQIVVASLSCNSKSDRGARRHFIRNLTNHDPDLLFFAGDQSYDHSQHTAAWLMWGRQFGDVIRNRPVVSITDDHDVGHANLWGENGKAPTDGAPSGGYAMPPAYVNMVQRCQTWHLPDPYDPTPVLRGITVYYTSLNVGGIDFAILEDRKFKSGPQGKLPPLEPPRPDHINAPDYDPATIDLPNLKLLGDRQLHFLNEWGQDWTDAQMKCVLSQTNFCGAVHLHGSFKNRLLADLDCNGWPQTGRNKALRAIRRALACQLAGDQHLAVVTQHGIDDFRDGPFTAASPAIVNEIYGRWWWPEGELPGANPIVGSPLPWTGDYRDGLGNKLTMFAYANPGDDNLYRRDDNDVVPPDNPGDGYALVRFNKAAQTIEFECWPAKSDVRQGISQQYPGWPITIGMQDNDGRQKQAYLPQLRFPRGSRPVVQVVEESTQEILYTQRVLRDTFQPYVYRPGRYTVKVGRHTPNQKEISAIESSSTNDKVIRIRDF